MIFRLLQIAEPTSSAFHFCQVLYISNQKQTRIMSQAWLRNRPTIFDASQNNQAALVGERGLTVFIKYLFNPYTINAATKAKMA